jgi:selenocysteine-specific elongation factor
LLDRLELCSILIHAEGAMSHIVIGTAGHVDHGKTALIRALTGIDTDRLQEEKRRGLSIDLGFAYFDLPGGRRAGIIDVPGHERFIHNMLAGATSMDVVLLVVAADEGVMPQTRDHLEILDLLQVGSGIVAISKIDLVGEEETHIVRMEIDELLAGTTLESSPVVTTSTATGEGIEDLRGAIAECGQRTSRPPTHSPFRLPVDRVFTMPGFGTVVTGTTVAGRVEKNQQVRILPRDRLARVRSIQVHEEDVSSATEGQRTALNLVGVAKRDIRRGSTVCDPEIARVTAVMDAKLRISSRLTDGPRGNARVKLHLGTDEVMARVLPLEDGPLAAGKGHIVQLRLQRPTVAAQGDRFALRDPSGSRTIGGGTVLDAFAKRQGKRRGLHARALRSLEAPTDIDKLVGLLNLEGASSLAELLLRLNRTPSYLEELLSQAASDGKVIVLGRGREAVCLSSGAFEHGIASLRQRLEELHASNPGEAGFPPSLVRQGCPSTLGERVFKHCVEELRRSGEVLRERGLIRLRDRGVMLSGEQTKARRELEKIFRQSGVTPPRPEEAVRLVSRPSAARVVEEAMRAMVKMGELVPVGGGLLFHSEALKKATETITRHLREHGRITVAEARDLLGSSRKYLVPLLEHMDKAGYTIRQGDYRIAGGRA